MKSIGSLAGMVLCACAVGVLASPKQRIVFEEQQIEGKIRRPQLVLIKADQRPEFPPMVIQGLSKQGGIASFVSEEVIESSPYDGAFELDGDKVSNYRH
jgi:hypothetical protein